MEHSRAWDEHVRAWKLRRFGDGVQQAESQAPTSLRSHPSVEHHQQQQQQLLSDKLAARKALVVRLLKAQLRQASQDANRGNTRMLLASLMDYRTQVTALLRQYRRTAERIAEVVAAGFNDGVSAQALSTDRSHAAAAATIQAITTAGASRASFERHLVELHNGLAKTRLLTERLGLVSRISLLLHTNVAAACLPKHTEIAEEQAVRAAAQCFGTLCTAIQRLKGERNAVKALRERARSLLVRAVKVREHDSPRFRAATTVQEEQCMLMQLCCIC